MWNPKDAKKISKRERLVGLNKWIRRKWKGSSRNAFIYNPDADCETSIQRITEIRTKYEEREKIEYAKWVLRRQRLKLKVPFDIIHLFDIMLIEKGAIHFPYLTPIENKIITYRADGKSLPQIARAVSGGNKGARRNSYKTKDIHYLLRTIRDKIRHLDSQIRKPKKKQIIDFMNQITPETVFDEIPEKKTKYKQDVYTRTRKQQFDERYMTWKD